MVVASKDYTAGFNDGANGLLECIHHPPMHRCLSCDVMLDCAGRAIYRVHPMNGGNCTVERWAIMTEGSEDYCRGWHDLVNGVRHSFSCHPESCSCMPCQVKSDIVRNVALRHLHRN